MSVLVRCGRFSLSFFLSPPLPFFPYSSCRPAFLFFLSVSLSIFPLPLSPAPVALQVLMALWDSIKAAGALSHFSLRIQTDSVCFSISAVTPQASTFKGSHKCQNAEIKWSWSFYCARNNLRLHPRINQLNEELRREHRTPVIMERILDLMVRRQAETALRYGQLHH